MAERKQPSKSTSIKRPSGKSSFTVRTDAVIASTGKPHFYGEKVKLSEEEARPLLNEGKVSKE